MNPDPYNIQLDNIRQIPAQQLPSIELQEMAGLGSLVAESIRMLPPLFLRQIVLPAEYAQAVRKEKKGYLTLKSQFVEIAGLGELRGVGIHSPKIDIVTVFFFPLAKWQLPIFAMEFVVLGYRPIVAVVDAVCLLPRMSCSASVESLLGQIHAQFPDVKQADDPPAWYRECQSGLDFLVRPTSEAELCRMAQVHLQVWSGVIALLATAQPFNATGVKRHQERIQEYKNHHRIHSPGRPLMLRSFGEMWTQEFFSKYLFH